MACRAVASHENTFEPGFAFQLRRGSPRSLFHFERKLAEMEGVEPRKILFILVNNETVSRVNGTTNIKAIPDNEVHEWDIVSFGY